MKKFNFVANSGIMFR